MTNRMTLLWRMGRPRTRRRQSASAAIIGVAIIVLVGFIGSWLVASARLSSATGANRSMAAQAYYIADAGVEWAAKHATTTSTPVPFGSGQFEVVANGDAWDSVASVGDKKCTICSDVSPNPPSTATSDGGLEYVLRSRVYGYSSDSVDFIIMNTSDLPITFNSLKVTWGSPTAYFQTITTRVVNGTNYGTIWNYIYEADHRRWASGEQDSFNRVASVTLPAHYSAEMHFIGFRRRQSGWGGGSVNMRNAVVGVEFYNGGVNVGSISVELAPT